MKHHDGDELVETLRSIRYYGDNLLISAPIDKIKSGKITKKKSPGGESNTRSQDYSELLITVSRLSQLGHREDLRTGRIKTGLSKRGKQLYNAWKCH